MYLGAAKHLGVSPSKVAMVAAHVEDLRAAASCGLKTVYVRRPFEWSRGEEKIIEDETRVHEEFDVVVNSFLELVEVVRWQKDSEGGSMT
jgi:FMN phosphatase YigB (HAD superfamily)